MKTVVLLGSTGQLGKTLRASLQRHYRVISFSSNTLNLAEPDCALAKLEPYQWDYMINAAAYTDVDQAEVQPSLASTINCVAPGLLAQLCHQRRAVFIHYSTDYVFSGAQDAPYTEKEQPQPINRYGESKLGGEELVRESGARHVILRTSWLYSLEGRNFYKTIRDRLLLGQALQVVTDQVGTPTSAQIVAEGTLRVLQTYEDPSYSPVEGTWHLTASGQTSWFGFSEAIAEGLREKLKLRLQITPISSRSLQQRARRPTFSALCNGAISERLNWDIPDWHTALKQVIETDHIRR